LRAELDYKI